MSEARDRYTFANESDAPAGVTDCVRAVIKNWDNIDDPDHLYLTGFAEDVDFTLPPNKAKGHDQIKALRLAAINSKTGPITDVNHTLKDVYVKAGDSNTDTVESVWTGVVAYTVLGGKIVTEEFATKTVMRKASDGSYKVSWARIYSDTASLGTAIMEAMASSGSPTV